MCNACQKSVNSLCNIPTSELLLTHVAYYKKIREMYVVLYMNIVLLVELLIAFTCLSWLMIAAVRYSHLRKKLMDMGAPASTAMDRILQKEKEDISLKKVAAILQLPEPRFDGVITALEEDDSMKLDDT